MHTNTKSKRKTRNILYNTNSRKHVQKSTSDGDKPARSQQYTIYNRVGRCTAELLRIFDFENGGRPPSRIRYDAIADHPRPVFDGPNNLLKLHVDCVYILRDIAIFIFGPFGLKLPIHANFEEFLGRI